MSYRNLPNEEFFLKLTDEFRTHKHGSISLTLKRMTLAQCMPLTDQITDDPRSDEHPQTSLPILIRATNGKKETKKVKFSTVVDADKQVAFFKRYAEVCKSGMGSLRPRDKSKKKGKGRSKKKKSNT